MAMYSDNTISHDVSSDATFRAWVTKIRAACEGAGLVRTSDTGQIDPTSVTAPAINTNAGYDIFRFSDSEQGSDPIYLKLSYGRGAATSRTNLAVSVGTGSDGAGTLTNASSVIAMGSTQSSPTGNGYIYATFYDGAFYLMSHPQPTGLAASSSSNATIMCAVERLRDVDSGAIVTGGIALIGFSGNSGLGTGHTRRSGSWDNTFAPGANPPSLKSSNKVRAGCYYPSGYPAAPFQSFLFTYSDGPALGDSGSIDILGVGSKTYQRIPVMNNNSNQSVGFNGGTLLVRT